LYAGEFEYALELLNKAYELKPTESILLRIVEVLDEFKNERPKAIQLLETHHRMNHVSVNVYLKLLLLYKKEQNIDGILETYKVMYTAHRKDDYLDKIIDAYVYKRDMKGAIEFLEEDKSKPKILYELYKIQKDFSKAISLADTLYDRYKDSKWIAEKAVLIFENAKDKNDKNMINDVLKYLKKAIDLGNDDSIYLNYYGYTLIDKEVDIQKGMKVIKNALLQQPNNTYYLDSLAWGYYKENKCTKAYTLMKRVVDEEGLEEEEISTHWNAIRLCK
jgi:lipopolysaccharide biosynthesis regulator YciM